jgi:hypothetical protein
MSAAENYSNCNKLKPFRTLHIKEDMSRGPQAMAQFTSETNILLTRHLLSGETVSTHATVIVKLM